MWTEVALSAVPLILVVWRPPFFMTFLRWIGRSISAIMIDSNWVGVRLILTGFAIALMCLMAIAFHECGHLLAGLSLGFRCRAIRIGRFRLDQGFRVSRHRDSGDANLGWVVMIPEHWQNIRFRQTLMLLAGPLASFLSGYAVLRFSTDHYLISGFFIGVSFFFAAFNILPLSMTSQFTDGARIWMLIFTRARAERYLAILRLTEEIDRGVSLESLSSSDLERAIVLKDESPDTVWTHMVAFLAAYAQQDDGKAGELLETAFKYSGYAQPSMRERLALHAAMFQAAKRGRMDLAQQWLADVPNATQFPEARSKIEAMTRNGLKTSPQECHHTSL